ncbi:MAG: AIM24 family protein, partial [Bacteroidota bacterium]
MAHDIDFQLIGDDLQIVEVELDPGEAVRAEAGAMLYMDASVRM